MPATGVRVRFFASLALLFLTCMLMSGRANAQVTGAMLKGTVTDPTGAFVPKAQVSIIDVATGNAHNVTTDASGGYAAANLRPGDYQVRVTATGFAAEVRSGITLAVGAQQVLDISLRVGQMSQEIVVAGEAPTVELASSEISAEVTSNTVRELPLNGRSWTDLATLQPGVTQINTQPSFTVGADRGNRGFGSQISVSGSRPQMDNYRLDGVTMNGYSNAAPGSVTGEKLGVDAVQEFSVITTNQGAEYGRTAGGVVNAVTKSGTNQIHGTGYEFLRNSALDARNFFDDPASPIPPFRRNQFGASIGGPVIKDRTFFFADYEGVRQYQGHSIVATVPSRNARVGILSSGGTPQSPCLANSTLLDPNANVCVDNSAAKYLVFYPLPDAGTESGDTGIHTFVQNQVVREDFVTGRVDHKFSDKDSLFGTIVWDRTPYSTPDGLNNVLLGDFTKDQMYIVEWTHSFKPNFVNAARFGFNRQRADVDYGVSAINPAAADTSLGANPGRTATQVTGLQQGIPLMTGGVGANPIYYYRWNSFQYHDDAFYTSGKHSFKFGGSVERMQLNATGLSNPNGIFTFKGLASFLTNAPSKYNSGVGSTLRSRGYRQTIFGLYVQDDWRIRPNLTLNLGLRYEMVTVEKETTGQTTALYGVADPLPHCGIPADGCASVGAMYQNPTRKDFQPRVGFAWDPFHNGKTAVRGGFGLFDNLPLIYEYTGMEILAAPFFQIGSINSAAALKNTFFAGVPPLGGNPKLLRGAYIENNMPRNYVMQWNLNIQREITPSVTAFLGYVGSHGVHMPLRIDDYDIVLPTLTSAGYLFPKVDVLGDVYSPPLCAETDPGNDPDSSCSPPARLNENFGSIRGIFYSGSSIYHALEAGVTKKMTHGFQLQGSFTWSKSIDDSSGTGYADQFSNSMSSLVHFDNRLLRGVSDFNIGRTFVVNGIWQVPEIKSLTGFAGGVVNGWQLQSIFKMNDGIPFTATFGTGGDPQGLLNSDDWAYPNRLGGSGCKSLVNPGNPNNYVKTQCFAIPTAPDATFWNANCDPTPPSVGGAIDPASLQCFNLRGNAGRNIMTAPGLINLDFAVFKNNHIRKISETFNVQFRAEIFNIVNRANFAPPVLVDQTDIFNSDGTSNPSAGQLKSTITDPREVQFGLKIIW